MDTGERLELLLPAEKGTDPPVLRDRDERELKTGEDCVRVLTREELDLSLLPTEFCASACMTGNATKTSANMEKIIKNLIHLSVYHKGVRRKNFLATISSENTKNL